MLESYLRTFVEALPHQDQTSWGIYNQNALDGIAIDRARFQQVHVITGQPGDPIDDPSIRRKIKGYDAIHKALPALAAIGAVTGLAVVYDQVHAQPPDNTNGVVGCPDVTQIYLPLISKIEGTGASAAVFPAPEEEIVASAIPSITVEASAIYTTSPDSPDPSDIVYNPTTGKIHVADGEVEEPPYFNDQNILIYTVNEETLRLEATFSITKTTNEPVGYTVDYRNPDLAQQVHIIASDNSNKAYYFKPGQDGIIDSSDLFRTVRLPVTSDLEAVAFDTTTGELFYTDAVGHTLHKIGPEGTFTCVADTAHPEGEATGITDPEGLAVNEARGLLALVTNGSNSNLILEMDRNGHPVRRIIITGANIRAASGVTVLPYSDPNFTRYLITDRGIDNNSTAPGVEPNDGRIIEVLVPNAGTERQGQQAEKSQVVRTPIGDNQEIVFTYTQRRKKPPAHV